MARQFPHLNDTVFPYLGNIDVYKYRNNFDYSRWQDNARIKLVAVPWDAGYVNVCEWATDTARDAYFDKLAGYKVDEPTMFQVQPDGSVKVPVPFNAATQYNYLVLEYPVMPTATEPLQNAAPARQRYYYFCEGVEELAPSTTLCRVELDVWTTYINSVGVSGMMLARGHAPMAAVSADTYLANPRANCRYLQAPDVSYGSFERANPAGSKIYNADVWAVVSMTGNSKSSAWGTKAGNDWKVPADVFSGSSAPRMDSVAVEPSLLETFLNAVIAVSPQAFQTIRAVWFAPKELVSTGSAYTFAGVTVRELNLKGAQTANLATLSKAQFGYDGKYADMAKLYTYPYARIMVSDHNGSTVEIKVEETAGSVGCIAALDLVAPYMAVTAQLSGIGGASQSVTFANVSAHTAQIAGRAYDTLRTWSIPTFEVYMSAAKRNDYATHFDRAQANTALTNAYTSATASNATVNSNAKSNALATKDNSEDAADAGYRASMASSNTSYASTGSANRYQADIYLNAARQQAAGMAQSMYQSAIQFATDNEQRYLNLAAQGASSAASGVIAGAAGGPAGAAVGGATALASTAFSALTVAAVVAKSETAMQQSNDGQNAYLQAMYGGGFSATNPNSFNALFNSFTGGTSDGEVGEAALLGRQQNSDQNTLSRNLNEAQRQNSRNLVKGGSGYRTTETGAVTAQGTYTGTAVRSYNNAVSIADATKATANANAGRTRATAQSAITNSVAQAALGAPEVGGTLANASQADTMPMGWFCWVETQGAGAIGCAAAQFARYGYQLNQAWDFEKWQVMKNFTYWQCDDVWVSPKTCPQGAAALIRSILIEGTTVWRDPAIIGTIDVWEN